MLKEKKKNNFFFTINLIYVNMGQCQGHYVLYIAMVKFLPEVFVFLVLYSYSYRPADNRAIMVSPSFLQFPLTFVRPVMRFAVDASLEVFALDLFCTWVQTYFYRRAFYRLSQLL